MTQRPRKVLEIDTTHKIEKLPEIQFLYSECVHVASMNDLVQSQRNQLALLDMCLPGRGKSRDKQKKKSSFRNFDDLELLESYRSQQKIESRPFFTHARFKPTFIDDDDYSGDEDSLGSLTPREYVCLEDRMAARGWHWVDGKLVHISTLADGEHSPDISPPRLRNNNGGDDGDEDSPRSPMESPLY
mmetsp:Transcript_8908/g.11670  ORF Transcript_8908/g.11670 Transcript_8908/m.11670 type:complete len:187 (+) Transcript_8908:74-634(+)|eukprot:CAMPEP_0114337804 /NCGR_PEP_ID=MMETSP0101-20121206/6612_1 /TAXON_ID=38822 ORGANISM="Pteridomonas danica, Strain PT" /NCGR_SAMPLE_ID=MMETSP0101 /ASSEMBLY_ACC=CAM_ASM_000211 /LENGTH=186 /DNA_ID=CAMNT_0001470171 /DNA_START=15 /DNA_END=575 /DNA_ORIENTATION=+